MGIFDFHVRAPVRCEAAAEKPEETAAVAPMEEEPEPEYMKTQQYQLLGKDLYHGVYEAVIPPPVPVPTPPQTPQPKWALTAPWIRDLAYHHGNYVPEHFTRPLESDEIQTEVDNFAAKVQKDQPSDACKYLLIEEYRCLQVNRFNTETKAAASSCVKWFDEWQKCKWDQEKFNSGYTHMEGPRLMTKRRPYIGYPDFKML